MLQLYIKLASWYAQRMNDSPKDFGAEIERRLNAAASDTKGRSGRVMLYLEPELHAQFKAFCRQRGLSMNRAATIAIETMIEHYSE